MLLGSHSESTVQCIVTVSWICLVFRICLILFLISDSESSIKFAIYFSRWFQIVRMKWYCLGFLFQILLFSDSNSNSESSVCCTVCFSVYLKFRNQWIRKSGSDLVFDSNYWYSLLVLDPVYKIAMRVFQSTGWFLKKWFRIKGAVCNSYFET